MHTKVEDLLLQLSKKDNLERSNRSTKMQNEKKRGVRRTKTGVNSIRAQGNWERAEETQTLLIHEAAFQEGKAALAYSP